MFKYNILIFNFWKLLIKNTNPPAHEPTSTRTHQHTNQPAHEPTSTRTNQHTNQPAPRTNQHTNQPQNRHNKAQKAVSRVFV